MPTLGADFSGNQWHFKASQGGKVGMVCFALSARNRGGGGPLPPGALRQQSGPRRPLQHLCRGAKEARRWGGGQMSAGFLLGLWGGGLPQNAHTATPPLIPALPWTHRNAERWCRVGGGGWRRQPAF